MSACVELASTFGVVKFMHTPDFYRDRAQEARLMAAQFNCFELREQMEMIGELYDELATTVEAMRRSSSKRIGVYPRRARSRTYGHTTARATSQRGCKHETFGNWLHRRGADPSSRRA
jgi:hypothetical protein